MNRPAFLSHEHPTASPSSPRKPAGRSARTLILSKDLTRALEQLSHNHFVSPLVTLLASFIALRYRYTSQNEQLIGVANFDKTSRPAGLAHEALPMQVDLSGDPTFQELLGRVWRKTAEIQAQRTTERIGIDLQTGDVKNIPLVLAAFQAGANGDESITHSPNGTNGFFDEEFGVDMALVLVAGPHHLTCRLDWRSNLHDERAMARMLEHYENFLKEIAARPDQPISEVDFLTAAERQQLLVTWNDTTAPYPSEACLHELIEAQVERSPDAVAVVYQGQQLSYRRLNQQANQLARYLRSAGVKPGDMVGLCLERSLDMLIAVLGVLKAGSSYCPLDPANSPERLAAMLADARVPLVITQTRLVPTLPQNGTRLLSLDAEWAQIHREGDDNLKTVINPSNRLYAIFTSGSVGKPKLAGVFHRGFVNLMHWFISDFSISATDNVLLVSSFNFDLTQKNLYATLLTGGCLFLMPSGIYDPAIIRAEIAAHRITLLNCTPSAFYPLIDNAAEDQMAQIESLRHVFLGGEPIAVSRLRAWAESPHCHAQVVNTYGPTECTDICASYRLTLATCPDEPVPIGRPIPNVRLYVLDRNLALVPEGVVGELCIAGAGVGEGYLNDPALTQHKFVPDPFDAESGRRLYRTGDLVRLRGDGNLEFHGRIDHQVKIRGFRIELGEIETLLSRHPAVRQAIVVTREDVSSEARLVAYVVAKPESTFSLADLRQYVADNLPSYMVPSAFLLLDSFPLTPNGKVDRRSLPAPEKVVGPPRSIVSPRDHLELQLTEMWEGVLGVQPIGVTESFFDLGGNSLLAARLFALISKKCGKNLPLATLLQAPTVALLARALHTEGWTTPWSSLVPIQSGGSRLPLYIVHADDGDVIGFRDLALELGPEQPVYGLQARGLDLRSEPLSRIEDMATQYIAEIRAVQAKGPYLLAGSCFGGFVVFEMAQQLRAQGENVALMAMFNTPGPKYGQPNLVQRFADYVSLMQRLGPKERLTFVFDKTKRLIEQSLYYCFRKSGTSLPSAFRSVGNCCHHAFQSYRPTVYEGRLTLFRAEKQPFDTYRDLDLGWEGLASEGCEIIPMPGMHLDMVAKPLVRILGDKLRSCLDRAQAKP